MLDAGPLGLVTNPRMSPESEACAQWLQTHITSGSRTIIPEIADYEVRRELLRANKTKGISRLDDLANLIEYLPITTAAMRQAAQLWGSLGITMLNVKFTSIKPLPCKGFSRLSEIAIS
jgi:hypothetical protein